MKVATSIIDPIPTQLFKSFFASLGSVVLNIINDKILQCIVASQLHTHFTDNNFLNNSNLAFQSTETALVKVTNDLLIATDSGSLSILILLDLSPAFDTVDHALLLTHLETVFGVTDTVLNWFKSYLSDRRQFDFLGGCHSKVGSVQFGVPQGSILSPLLLSVYIFPLGQLLRS